MTNATALDMGFTVLGCKNSETEQEYTGDVAAQLLTMPPEPPCSLCSAQEAALGVLPVLQSARATQETINRSLNHVQRVLIGPDLPAYMWGQRHPKGNGHMDTMDSGIAEHLQP